LKAAIEFSETSSWFDCLAVTASHAEFMETPDGGAVVVDLGVKALRPWVMKLIKEAVDEEQQKDGTKGEAGQQHGEEPQPDLAEAARERQP
jgi:hypothetical protein